MLFHYYLLKYYEHNLEPSASIFMNVKIQFLVSPVTQSAHEPQVKLHICPWIYSSDSVVLPLKFT